MTAIRAITRLIDADDFGTALPARGFGDAVLMPFAPGASMSGGGGANAANQYRGVRHIVHKTGTLTDCYVWVTVSSGNVECVVLDDAATTRNRLWTSGVIACPAASGGTNTWRSLGNPNLAVTRGQHIDVALGTSDGTASFMRWNSFLGSSNMFQLPTGFLPAPDGAAPLFVWNDALGSMPYPSTRSEANLQLQLLGFLVLMRIV